MNTTKIQALYPFFCDCLRTKAAQPQRCLLDMMETKLIADQLLEGPRRFSVAVRDQANPVKRFDRLGMLTDELLYELVPARTWAWAEKQLPADPGDEMRWAIERTGLLVRLHAHTPVTGQPGQPVPEVEPSVWLPRQASATEAAPLLRGLRAFQAKRRKRARRLLAQLIIFHWQQQATLAEVKSNYN
ncbi:hypothetical protein GCM10027422_28640 [Hymenobacter arcticus]